jgi:AraC family transcriptional regulator
MVRLMDPALDRRSAYVERVNAVIDHIETHLADELTLDALSGVAHFSPYHFHRVFTALVGETPHRFITRLRIERAATQLVQHPDTTVTQVGADCGFANPSSFARAFRGAFSMSATEWRSGGHARHERVGRSTRVIDPRAGGYGVLDSSFEPSTGAPVWRIGTPSLGPATVTLEQVPELEVAYVRHTGRYQGMEEVFTRIFEKLMRWAQPRGLVGPDTWVMAVYHDNPEITDDDRLRVSACVTVPPATAPSGPVGRMGLEGGTCAIGAFELGASDYSEAWLSLMAGWLPESGYEPDDRLSFERFPIDAVSADPARNRVDICLPVRPLAV